jgi:recombination associated protein RdgC
LREWLDHRRDVLVRRSKHRLDAIEHRIEVLGGYLVAYLNLDKVIKIIRNEDEPKPVLMKTFKLSDVQADAILNMRLRNLRKLEEMEIRQEDKALRTERKKLKEDLLHELLPRAFVRTSRMSSYVDKQHGWLVLDTSSRKSAENALTQVREALGSFPAVPLAPEEGPRVLMTDWLANGSLPAGLTLGDECELRDPATATGAIARCRRQDLDAEEIKEHLRNGKQVFQLGLVFDDRISFVLGEDLVLRKLKFLDAVLDELGDSQPDAAAEMDARFALLTLEMQRLLAKLEEWFGLPRPKDS